MENNFLSDKMFTQFTITNNLFFYKKSWMESNFIKPFLPSNVFGQFQWSIELFLRMIGFFVIIVMVQEQWQWLRQVFSIWKKVLIKIENKGFIINTQQVY